MKSKVYFILFFFSTSIFTLQKTYSQPKKAFEIGELPPKEVIDEWTNGLKNPEPKVRKEIVIDMWRARHPQTTDMLLDMVDDPDESVSTEAMYMVEMNQKLGIYTSIEKIKALAVSDRSFVRINAYRLMHSHKELKQFLGLIIKGFNDNIPEVREEIYKYFSYGKYFPEEALPLLIKAVQDDNIPINRAEAANSLYYYGSIQAKDALISVIDEKTEFVRGAIYHALISCGDESVVQILLPQTQSQDSETRRLSTHVLAWAKWVDQKIRDEAVVRAIDDPNELIRLSAYEWIRTQKVTAANPKLREHLEKYKTTYKELFESASYVADSETGGVLMQFLDANDTRIAELSLRGIGNSGNIKLVPLLIQRLIRKDASKAENITRTICDILNANPQFQMQREDEIEQVNQIVKQTKKISRLNEPIIFYQPDLAIVDVNFNMHSERCLLQRINGVWRFLGSFLTGIA